MNFESVHTSLTSRWVCRVIVELQMFKFSLFLTTSFPGWGKSWASKLIFHPGNKTLTKQSHLKVCLVTVVACVGHKRAHIQTEFWGSWSLIEHTVTSPNLKPNLSHQTASLTARSQQKVAVYPCWWTAVASKLTANASLQIRFAVLWYW